MNELKTILKGITCGALLLFSMATLLPTAFWIAVKMLELFGIKP